MNSLNKYHFVAICGVAMASVAAELKRAGCIVTGSDTGAYPPMSTFLEGQGIAIIPRFSPDNLPDDATVVIGNAVSRGNVELESALNRGLKLTSLPELISQRYLRSSLSNGNLQVRRPVVIAGTHGKTTTTTMTAKIFTDANKKPGWMIGGIPKDLPFPCEYPDGEYFVIEGDEYDAVYYDKRPKFMHYRPYHAILTSVEFDHADIYPNFDAVKHAFRQFVRLIPQHGTLTAWGDDDTVRQIANHALCPVTFYGESKSNHWQIKYQGNRDGSRLFDSAIKSPDGESLTLRLPSAGKHNALNALAGLIVAKNAGIPTATSLHSLVTFQGIARRLELLADKKVGEQNITLYDDFAHHPTAIRETLSALRSQYPSRRLWAVFEPRSNTMVRNSMTEKLASAMSFADVAVFAPVHRAERIPQDERLNRADVAESLRQNKRMAYVTEEFDEIVSIIEREVRPGDVIVLMSNGSFGGIKPKIVDILQSK